MHRCLYPTSCPSGDVILTMNWLQASNRGVPRTTESNLARRALWRTLRANASGCQRPLKPWCLVPVCEHGHGGCDDIHGDTRQERGLPFGRMLLVRPPHPMPIGYVRRGDKEMARAARRQGGSQARKCCILVKRVRAAGASACPPGRSSHHG